MSLRIISLNAWGGRLHAPLMRYLTDSDPDILCLQEVVRSPEAQSEWLTYRDHGVELPQRAKLFEEIGAALPAHAAFFFPTARGALYDGEKEIPSEFGLATFVRRSLPIIGQAMDFVHGAFSPDGWGNHPRARNAHCFRVFDCESRSALTVAHMHGLRDPGGKEDTPARGAQAHAFVKLVNKVRLDNDRLVACGDFNILPQSATFRTLGTLGLIDLVTAQGYTGTRTSYYQKDCRFADYMLVTPGVKVISFDVVAKPEVSDHCPLLLDIA